MTETIFGMGKIRRRHFNNNADRAYDIATTSGLIKMLWPPFRGAPMSLITVYEHEDEFQCLFYFINADHDIH